MIEIFGRTFRHSDIWLAWAAWFVILTAIGAYDTSHMWLAVMIDTLLFDCDGLEAVAIGAPFALYMLLLVKNKLNSMRVEREGLEAQRVAPDVNGSSRFETAAPDDASTPAEKRQKVAVRWNTAKKKRIKQQALEVLSTSDYQLPSGVDREQFLAFARRVAESD